MGVKRVLSLLILQLDESCVSQHINERRVRTLEEEDEATSSLGTAASPEMDTASANNDECDLEELERLENDGKDLEDSDDDDDDDDGTGNSQSDTVFGSDVASADVGNSRSVGNSGADISEDVASSGMQADEQQSSDEEIFQDAVSSEMPIGRTSSSADSEPIADVNTVRNESSTRSPTGNTSEEVVAEFPDTTIELQHISGSKFVPASSVNSTLHYYYK